MKKILIIVTGWLGDSLFASSIAKKLKEEGKYNQVDYLLGFPQTAPILAQNKYIDNIFVSMHYGAYPVFPATLYSFDQNIIYRKTGHKVYSIGAGYEEYDNIVTLPVNDLRDVPTVKFQKACGVENPTTEFDLSYPVSTEIIQEGRDQRFYSRVRKVIGVCQTWKQADESQRDVEELEEELGGYAFSIIKIGSTISQHEGANQVDKYLEMAQLMQVCDFVVGAEGGLLNLAAGLGVPTICATDFSYALFGPNGKLYQYDDYLKRITPSAFFDRVHTNLDHRLTNNYEIANGIADAIMDY